MDEQFIYPDGHFEDGTFGTPTFPATQTITPATRTSKRVMGVPLLNGGSVVHPFGIPSRLAFGGARVATPQAPIPDGWSDEQLAQLPWPDAQRALKIAHVHDPGAIPTHCGWHGAGFDARRGCFALAREDGPFAAFVGLRLHLHVHSRAVYVLLVDTADVPDDLSVTRRVFMALGNPSADYVSVSVRVFLEGRFQEDVA
jgi:hypothetical protein